MPIASIGGLFCQKKTLKRGSFGATVRGKFVPAD
nr:MAG TPA: hypothetical protein [Caudoviricetes sp.]